jgi:predicted transcriptional regulator
MRRDFIVVSPEETLEKLVDEQILGKGKRGLIVEQNDRVIGLLTFILSKQFQVPTGLPPQLPR